MGHDQLIASCIPIFFCFVPSVLAILLVPNLAFSIAEFTVSEYNSTCKSSFIEPRSWLIVDASERIALCAVILLWLVVFLYKYCDQSLRKGWTIHVVLIIAIFHTLFTFAWLIVGFVDLYRDNPLCSNQSIGQMILATLIWQLITFVFNLGFIPVIGCMVMDLRKDGSE